MEATNLTMFQSTVKTDYDRIYVKPLCDFFQINYANQVDRIKNDPILANSFGKNKNKLLFGDSYPRVTLDKKGFMRWIQLINPSTLPEDLREKFLNYQTLIYDYFYGTTESRDQIILLTSRKQQLREQMKELVRETKQVNKNLNMAIYQNFQYELPFSEQTSISN